MDLMEAAERGFARLGAEYKQLKTLADSCACSWEWATKEVWHLNPLYFEMNSERPGRRLKSEPAKKNGAFELGTDASGRIVIERQHTDVGCYETFYDWSKDPIETAHFRCGSRSTEPIYFQLARCSGGRVAQIARSAKYGGSLQTFHWEGPHVTKIEYLHADRKENGLQNLADYQIVRATYGSDGSVQRVVIDWMPRLPKQPKLQTQVVFERRVNPVEVDFRDDVTKVREMIEKAVHRYASKHDDPRHAKRHPAVARIELIFTLGDGHAIPWVHLCLDTDPKADAADGYTHPDFAKLQRKDWLPAVQAICDGRKAVVISTDGKKRTYGDRGLTQAVGKLLVSALLSARRDGVFEVLPRAKRCQLGVEDPTTGDFGWPSYKDQGKENLV